MDRDKLIEAIRAYIKKGLINGIVYQSGEHGFVDSALLADALLPLINAEIEAQKHRADVAEEALILACGDLSSYYYMTGAEALVENYIHQAAERLNKKEN